MKQALCFVLLACLSLPAMAADTDLESLPGYVDFGELADAYGEPRVMINISGFLLQFMAAASKNDPEQAALLRNLEGIRVNVYPTDGVLAPAQEQIATVKSALQKKGWQPVVQVRESDEEVQIFMKGDAAGMQGLTVMTVDEEEAVFINILGAIDPAKLTMVMDRLNVDVGMDSESGTE